MGKASRNKGREGKRRFYLAEAPFLKPEPHLDERNHELCIQCGYGAVAKMRDPKTGRDFFRTSPFRIVDTPHGKRVIHDRCIYMVRKGKETDFDKVKS